MTVYEKVLDFEYNKGFKEGRKQALEDVNKLIDRRLESDDEETDFIGLYELKEQINKLEKK